MTGGAGGTARPGDGILRDAGIDGSVRAAGHDGSVAALAVEASRWLALPEDVRSRVVARLKEAGYRYVAVGAPREDR